jgi:hypothetical protein
MGKTFSDYVKKTLPFMGGTIDLDLRALDVDDAGDFKRLLMERFEMGERKEGETDEQFEKRLLAYMPAWDKTCREVFSRTYTTKKGEKRGYYLRLAEVWEHDEDESKNISDGPSLWRRSTREFRLAVMMEIAGLAAVQEEEGKSSGSPSTSTVAAGPSTSSSSTPAITPDTACSPSASTAPEINVPIPFSRQA